MSSRIASISVCRIGTFDEETASKDTQNKVGLDAETSQVASSKMRSHHVACRVSSVLCVHCCYFSLQKPICTGPKC